MRCSDTRILMFLLLILDFKLGNTYAKRSFVVIRVVSIEYTRKLDPCEIIIYKLLEVLEVYLTHYSCCNLNVE